MKCCGHALLSANNSADLSGEFANESAISDVKRQATQLQNVVHKQLHRALATLNIWLQPDAPSWLGGQPQYR